MRIVIVNRNRRLEGGVEIYLDGVIPALAARGHELSLCHEIDVPLERKSINLPPGAPIWCTSSIGITGVVQGIRRWQPDVICTHNIDDVSLEKELIKIAPAVFFAHDYRGTCISGNKTFSQPTTKPCHRRFGWQCLLYYYPRRCGGLNPLTMTSQYFSQTRRLSLIHQYHTVVTHSEHMRMEYLRHGLPSNRVSAIPYFVLPVGGNIAIADTPSSNRTWRLVFVGRMDRLKGGSLLLKSLPLVQSAGGRPVSVVFAGDGPQRSAWESEARDLCRSVSGLDVKFAGWLDDAELADLYRASDLQVVPSLWPEPFGTVGVKAAIEGVPSAAFAVGGISEWLVDGVNGHLATGDPPKAEGLAHAIVNCLRDEKHHQDLRRNAAEMARRFTADTHLSALIDIFRTAASSRR